MADRRQLLEWSFLASLVGAILVLVGSVMMGLMMGAFLGIGAAGDFPGPFAWFAGFFALAWIVGLAAGVLGLVAAFRIRASPRDPKGWGTVAIVAGGVSLVGFGGGMLGAAGLIGGGILAHVAADRPEDAPTPA